MEVQEPEGRSGGPLAEAEPATPSLSSARSLKSGETRGLKRGDRVSEEPTWEPVRAGAFFRPRRSWGSYGSAPHFLLRGTRCSALAVALLQVPGRGWQSRPSLVRVPAVSAGPATGSGLGAEFATHLKVARN